MVCVALATAVSFGGIESRSATTSADTWGKYTAKDEEFSVRMPSQPWTYFNLITGRSGKLIPERIYSTYSNGAVYLIVSYDRSSLKDTFENFKLHHCSQAKITPIKDKTLSGLVGKQYSVKFGDVIGVLEIYATAKHGYAVATVQETDNAPLRDYFISTFSLTAADSRAADLTADTPPLSQSDSSGLGIFGKQVTENLSSCRSQSPYIQTTRGAPA